MGYDLPFISFKFIMSCMMFTMLTMPKQMRQESKVVVMRREFCWRKSRIPLCTLNENRGASSGMERMKANIPPPHRMPSTNATTMQYLYLRMQASSCCFKNSTASRRLLSDARNWSLSSNDGFAARKRSASSLSFVIT